MPDSDNYLIDGAVVFGRGGRTLLRAARKASKRVKFKLPKRKKKEEKQSLLEG